MRLLLDAHALLWLAFDPGRIPADVRRTINDPANELFVSIATIWELGIKSAKGKLASLPPNDFERFVDMHCERLGMQVLPVTTPHIVATTTLPDIHRDPFDRMLVAQAQVEQLTLVTSDSRMTAYPVNTFW